MPPGDTIEPKTSELVQAIIINLFVLSLINERIANFLKLNMQDWFPDPRTQRKKYTEVSDWRRYIGRNLKNFRNVEVANKAKEKERESGILNLAVLCGIFVAIIAHADFFILLDKGRIEQDWPKVSLDLPPIEIKIIIGYILTGFFISLGSKFWHDLLDIVLYTSNMKRRLAEPETFAIDRSEQLMTTLSYTDSDVAQLAYQTHKADLEALSNVSYVTVGPRRVDGQLRFCLCVFLTDDDTSQIPTSFPVQLPNAVVRNALVISIPQTTVPKAHLGSGDMIQRSDSDFTGTLCCLLQEAGRPRGSLYLLTCCHVMTDRRAPFFRGDIEDGATVKVDGQPIGRWQYGFLNTNFDIALIRVDDDKRDQAAAGFSSVLPRTKDVTDPDFLQNQTAVTVIRQRGRQASTGEVIAYHTDTAIPIDYNNRTIKITKLLEMSTDDNPRQGQTITAGGDSGALVFETKTRLPLGMIIAGNERSSFAIPLENILDFKNLELYQNA